MPQTEVVLPIGLPAVPAEAPVIPAFAGIQAIVETPVVQALVIPAKAGIQAPVKASVTGKPSHRPASLHWHPVERLESPVSVAGRNSDS